MSRLSCAELDLWLEPEGPTNSSITDKSFVLGGERGRNRTFNLLIKSQLLCQLSYAPGTK